MTKISTKAIEANNIEATEVAAMNAANETEALPCCPKGKTTVLAVIEGKEREITLARTIYSMEELKKNQEKILEAVDRNKLLDQLFHLATPEIFWQSGVTLYNQNGEEIAEGTEDVFVPVETATTYWRFGFDTILKNVQVRTFESVEEYAQVTGTTDLFSRSRNTVEKVGIAALATGDDTYKAVYELCRKTGMPGSTAMAYLGVQLKGSTTIAMSIGLNNNETPATNRTLDEALALYKQVCMTFTPAEAKKRYPIRAINSVIYVHGYTLEQVMKALQTIPSSEVHRLLITECASKESCISLVIKEFIELSEESKRKAVPMAA
jgi:hypothetical protein